MSEVTKAGLENPQTADAAVLELIRQVADTLGLREDQPLKDVVPDDMQLQKLYDDLQKRLYSILLRTPKFQDDPSLIGRSANVSALVRAIVAAL